MSLLLALTGGVVPPPPPPEPTPYPFWPPGLLAQDLARRKRESEEAARRLEAEAEAAERYAEQAKRKERREAERARALALREQILLEKARIAEIAGLLAAAYLAEIDEADDEEMLMLMCSLQ